MTQSERPDNVPEDWIEIPCDNPACLYMAWVPNVFLDLPAGKVVRTCSMECATALAVNLLA